jgi:hypothetical protein
VAVPVANDLPKASVEGRGGAPATAFDAVEAGDLASTPAASGATPGFSRKREGSSEAASGARTSGKGGLPPLTWGAMLIVALTILLIWQLS